MILSEIKKQLALDQGNIFTGQVIGVGTTTVKVKTKEGKEINVSTDGGYSLGDLVQVHTDGTTHSIAGKAPIAAVDGEIIVHV